MRECGNSDIENVPLEIGGERRNICVQIKSSPRARNFRMWIGGENTVRLTKPARASKRDAMEFFKSNLEWLKKNIADYRAPISLKKHLEKNPFVYADGKKWKVWLKESRAGAFFVEDAKASEIVFAFDAKDADASLEGGFRGFAKKEIEKLAAEISEKTGIKFKRISVRDQSSRWASRSSAGTLSFNWRMALLPYELQKYIVCHELAHARFMDHSVSFWIFLNRIIPNAKKLDARLSKEGKDIFNIARAE